MPDNKKAGKEVLEEVLRGVAERSAVSNLRSETERMRAALALAHLDEHGFNQARVSELMKIINGGP